MASIIMSLNESICVCLGRMIVWIPCCKFHISFRHCEFWYAVWVLGFFWTSYRILDTWSFWFRCEWSSAFWGRCWFWMICHTECTWWSSLFDGLVDDDELNLRLFWKTLHKLCTQILSDHCAVSNVESMLSSVWILIHKSSIWKVSIHCVLTLCGLSVRLWLWMTFRKLCIDGLQAWNDSGHAFEFSVCQEKLFRKRRTRIHCELKFCSWLPLGIWE